MNTKAIESGLQGENLPEAELNKRKRGKGLFLAEETDNILNSLPTLVLLLDMKGEILYFNRPLPEMINQKELTGLLFGEAFGCIHASSETASGGNSSGGNSSGEKTSYYKGRCGTTEFCEMCGAFKALEAAKNGAEDVKECRIIRSSFPAALDLRVWTGRFVIGGDICLIAAVENIFPEKRQQVLENAFFNELIVSAEGLRVAALLLGEAPKETVRNIRDMVYNLSQKLIDEIKSIREITLAEGSKLILKNCRFSSLELVNSLVNTIIFFEEAKGRDILVARDSDDIEIYGDRTLMGRVLHGMIMNALEASEPGECIKTGCYLRDSKAEFTVRNNSFMSRSVQLQVFQRSFTTKGAGRGIGTYAMKLLTEEYMKGNISFVSSPEEGTVFTASFPVNISSGGLF